MTSRAHIAMFSIAAHGHVNPSLEVIRELVADRLPLKSDQLLLDIGAFMWRYSVDEWLMRGRQRRVSLLS
jgi:precorrin-6B methylase 2